MAGKDNLKPVRSVDEAREKGRKGGIQSGKARKEKKLMSQIYAEFLQNEHDVIWPDGKTAKMTGAALANRVMGKVITKGDSSAVRLLKEIREGTEGTKITTDGIPMKFTLQAKVKSRQE